MSRFDPNTQAPAADLTLSPVGLALSESLKIARYLALIAAPLGALVGAAVAAYDWVVNDLLWRHISDRSLPVQILAPAVGMSLAGLLLQWFRVRSSSMADEVVNAYHDPDTKMPLDQAAGKLAASISTMGFGASAGMEGASKWLGATLGLLLQRTVDRFRPTRWEPRITMLAGGSAGIAAIFRAPLSGAIMGVESPFKHDLAHEALIPALVASATSFTVFTHLRPATPYFPLTVRYVLSERDLLIAVPLGLSAGLASHLFLGTLQRLRGLFAKHLPSIFARTSVGGVVLAGLA